MDFILSREAPVGSECRRLFLAEADAAVARLAAFSEDPDATIHETRKSNKRMRAICLLARPVLDSGDLSEANRIIRNAARRFAEARDLLVRQETCDHLAAQFGPDRAGTALETVKARFRAEHAAIMNGEGFGEEVEAVSREFLDAMRLVGDWHWDRVDFEIVVSAVVSNYRLGLRDFETARASRDPHDCHEWRKRVKYLSFHFQLLREFDPEAFGIRSVVAEELASWLGEHHDLAVFEESLEDVESLGITEAEAKTLTRLSQERRLELETDAFERGALVYFDRPEALRERLVRS